MQIIDEESFLAKNKASKYDIGDSALHKNKGRNSDKAWKRIVDNQAKKDHELLLKREELRNTYKELCLKGEIRPPTTTESLIDNSRGHDDNESVKAARRILSKRGIKW